MSSKVKHVSSGLLIFQQKRLKRSLPFPDGNDNKNSRIFYGGFPRQRQASIHITTFHRNFVPITELLNENDQFFSSLSFPRWSPYKTCTLKIFLRTLTCQANLWRKTTFGFIKSASKRFALGTFAMVS